MMGATDFRVPRHVSPGTRMSWPGRHSRPRPRGHHLLHTYTCSACPEAFRPDPRGSMRTSRLLGAAALAAASLLLLPPTLASAHPRPAPTPSVELDGLAAPFNLALKGGRTYFADGGLNLVGRLKSGGTYATIAADQPGASGVALSRNGKTIAFTTTVSPPDSMEITDSGLNIWGPRGQRVYADTLAYETAKNPDKINTYGVANPSPCVVDALTGLGFPVSYRGGIDSHAYSVAAWAGGWVVADAGSNALFRVNGAGKISTLSVLPPQPAKITQAFATKYGLPDCVIGVTYAFEAVPTDVEVGRDGTSTSRPCPAEMKVQSSAPEARCGASTRPPGGPRCWPRDWREPPISPWAGTGRSTCPSSSAVRSRSSSAAG